MFDRVEQGPPHVAGLTEIEPDYEYEYTLPELGVVVDFSVLVSPADQRILVVGLRYA